MDKGIIELALKQARRFMLLKHGLLGEHRFTGKQGVMDFVRQAGCLQFDPVDVCGKNADIALQSRVKGFKKSMLDELLYKDRLLFDYFDKNLCIMLTEDWKYFDRAREASRRRERPTEKISAVADDVKRIAHERGAVCSRDLGMTEKVDWYWSKLSEGGHEGPCGWLKDRFGVSWQIVPAALPRLLSEPDHEKSQRVMRAMLQMGKLGIAALEQAADGA
jgi:uncharacterized protein YcaQ